jgi:nicotinamide-nucleotide amidase
LASASLVGGLVVHTDSALRTVVGVAAEEITGYGSASPQLAAAMAEGARNAFGADIGIGVTALSTEPESLGTVHLSVVTPDGEYARSLPGNGTADEMQRERATPLALHLLRRALTRQA